MNHRSSLIIVSTLIMDYNMSMHRRIRPQIYQTFYVSFLPFDAHLILKQFVYTQGSLGIYLFCTRGDRKVFVVTYPVVVLVTVLWELVQDALY